MKGHDILLLPPYYPDLNPIELIWAHVAMRNTSFTMSQAKALCEDKISSMGAEEWSVKCKHVEKIERDYAAAGVRIQTAVTVTQKRRAI
ncbi:hypothetical protein J6590_082096 [Homalodisca vitripennis]|nr:hypothetical protein J6590_082096 [Homalodisca vitripennis]